jgi:hypothetical protein
MKQQPTAAQQALWHGAQSALHAALLTLCVAIGQWLIAGQLDLHTLWTVLGTAFLAAGSMLYKSISSNPNLAQAALDTANEAHAKIDSLAPWLAQKPKPAQAPKPIVLPVPPQGGAASLPVQYPVQYPAQQQTGNYPSDMATLAYPAVNPSAPPAMSFLQQPPTRGG